MESFYPFFRWVTRGLTRAVQGVMGVALVLMLLLPLAVLMAVYVVCTSASIAPGNPAYRWVGEALDLCVSFVAIGLIFLVLVVSPEVLK